MENIQTPSLQAVADGAAPAIPAPKTDGRRSIPRGPDGKFMGKNGPKVSGASISETFQKRSKWKLILGGVVAFFGLAYVFSKRQKPKEDSVQNEMGSSFNWGNP